MTARLATAALVAVLLLGGLALWERWGEAVVLASPSWLCGAR